MTKAQKNFVNYYIEQDFKNATAAYQQVFPKASYETARRNASRLLTKADVQEYMSAVIAEVLQRDKIPLEKRILDIWLKRAFYDPAEIVDGKGTLLHSLEELSRRGLSVCVEGIETRINAQGAETTKIKLADRERALEMLQQYIWMIKPQTQKIELEGLSDEVRARLALLYENETPEPINPANVEPQTGAPDYE
ncbi:MAG: terminase small subunit [Treponema sp.]|jgi:phage terminase small subunit|nr:terminase small subunit [Treponema sp.]